jgi:hypothetical protein
MSPGAIVQTRMPTAARSRAAVRVRATTPPFDAEYAACPIWPSNAAIDAVLTMTPRSPSSSGSPARYAGRSEAQHIERADEVDLDDLAERLEVVRCAVAVHRPLRPADARAMNAHP